LLTGWIEGDKDGGTGRGIGITLDRKIIVDEIRIAPGYSVPWNPEESE